MPHALPSCAPTGFGPPSVSGHVGVRLKSSSHGTFLCESMPGVAQDEPGVSLQPDDFTGLDCGGGKVMLRTSRSGKYLTAVSDQAVALKGQRSEDAEFTVAYLADQPGKLLLRSNAGKYLSANTQQDIVQRGCKPTFLQGFPGLCECWSPFGVALAIDISASHVKMGWRLAGARSCHLQMLPSIPTRDVCGPGMPGGNAKLLVRIVQRRPQYLQPDQIVEVSVSIKGSVDPVSQILLASADLSEMVRPDPAFQKLDLRSPLMERFNGWRSNVTLVNDAVPPAAWVAAALPHNLPCLCMVLGTSVAISVGKPPASPGERAEVLVSESWPTDVRMKTRNDLESINEVLGSAGQRTIIGDGKDKYAERVGRALDVLAPLATPDRSPLYVLILGSVAGKVVLPKLQSTLKKAGNTHIKVHVESDDEAQQQIQLQGAICAQHVLVRRV